MGVSSGNCLILSVNVKNSDSLILSTPSKNSAGYCSIICANAFRSISQISNEHKNDFKVAKSIEA